MLIDHYSLPKQWRWATKKELVSLAEVWEIRRQCEELFPDGYILFYVDGEYDVHCQRGLRQIANVEFDMTKTYVNQDPEDAAKYVLTFHISLPRNIVLENCKRTLRPFSQASERKRSHYAATPPDKLVVPPVHPFLIDENKAGILCVVGVWK